MKKRIGRWIVLVLGIAAFGWIGATALRDGSAEAKREVKDYTEWEEETLELAGLIPVQDGGRVKPLGTYAGFTMLGLHGARSMEVIDAKGEVVKIRPLEWMMDCLFRPELAHQLPTFRVEDSNVLSPFGIEVRSRRDRYSYNDLKPGLEAMRDKAVGYEKIMRNDPKLLDREEKQVLDLVYNVRRYEWLTGYLDFARGGLLKGVTHEGKVLDVSEVMKAEPKLRASIEASGNDPAQLPSEVRQILQLLLDAANGSKFELFLFPPPAVEKGADGVAVSAEAEKWMTAGQRIMAVFEKTTREPERCVEDIASLEKLARSLKDGEAAFRTQLSAYEAPIVKRADERGEYRSVPLEADYFKKNWFLYALAFFLLATVTAAVMFFTGQTKVGRIFYWSTVAATSMGLLYVIIPIVKRSIIMMRPPVGNLYDTIIFITMALVAFALVVEWMTRKRFVLAIAPMAAAFLIVLARRFEVGDGKDHLDPLVAVLRSNYWLTTHVITITLGYAAGLISAVISIVYVMMRVMGLDEGDSSIRRSVTRSVYGCLCLTLVLSLIGTVLGGIWANDSWGRFWGWDPKENGALMIVLWCLAILHARLGGYIREWGLHQASIFGAAVVGFSWWHVNFLAVGLHNYGFAADKKWAVNAFYAGVLFFMLMGLVGWVLDRYSRRGGEAGRRGEGEGKVDSLPVEV